MDEKIERLAGILYAYRRLMYEMGMETCEFDIPHPRHFNDLYRLCVVGRPDHMPPSLEKVQAPGGEFYEQFEIYGLKIRCHLPGEMRRRELEREREMATYEAKMREQQILMHPFPSILSPKDIEKLGLAGLGVEPDGTIGKKKT